MAQIRILKYFILEVSIKTLLLNSIFIFVFLTRLANAQNCPENPIFERYVTINSLEELIKNCQIKDIDSFLSKLPEDFKRRYTLLYRTKALGIASAEYPRIMLSGFGNYLTLSIGSDLGHKSSFSLEMMEYSNLTKDFSFKFINFDPEGKNSPRISNLNPALCMQCHDNSAIGKRTALWEDDPIWPGVYGSSVDRFDYIEQLNLPGQQFNYALTEDAAFKKYIVPKLGTQERFKHLASNLFHQNGDLYSFRSAKRLFWQLDRHSRASHLDSFIKHIAKRNISEEKVKYFLLGTTMCIPEILNPDQDYNSQKFIEKLQTLLPQKTIDKMFLKIRKKHNINTNDHLQIAQWLMKMFEQKLKIRFNRVYNENCRNMNSLNQEFGIPPLSNCSEIMNDAFLGYPKDRDFWENYATNQAPHISHNYLMLYMFFSFLDYPFEHWSMTKETFSGYSTSYNLPMDLQQALLAQFNFKQSDVEIHDYYEQYNVVGTFYRSSSDLPKFPIFQFQANKFLNDFCPNSILKKSKMFTSF